MSEQVRPGIFHRASKFEGFYKDLDKPIKETVDEILKAMAANYAASWLDAKIMAGYSGKWRFTVNGQYRIVANKRDGVEEFDLEFVGTKNQFKKKY